jgi:hypothetical protein
MSTQSEAPGSAAAGADPAPRPPGLSELSRVVLSGDGLRCLDQARARSGGDPAFRHRKALEAHELLALDEVAPPGRLKVLALDLQEDLRAQLLMSVPVPCQPDPSGTLPVAGLALLGLVYPRAAMFQALPGWAFVQVLEPHSVFHPNVGRDGRLCLGPSMSAGIRVVDLLVLAYAALALQSVIQVDEQDPAGVMNADAAVYFQQNRSRVPLTAKAILEA